MTTHYHTPIVADPKQGADASLFNSRFSSLDTGIFDARTFADAAYNEVVNARDAYPSLDARLDELRAFNSNVSSNASGAANAGQKVVTVDDSTGFLPNAPVVYTLLGGVVETNVVDTVDSPTQLTLITNIGAGGIPDNGFISVINPGTLSSTGAVTGAVSQQQTFSRGIISSGPVNLGLYGNYRSALKFETPGALVEGPWLIGTLTVDPLKHDNVFYINYNALRNNVGGAWERVETGEHCVNFAIESRFHATDPVGNRGQLEWYLRLDPALTGTPSWSVQPFSMTYNFDTPGSSFWLGQAANAAASSVYLYGETVIQTNDFVLKNAAGTVDVWSVDRYGAGTFGDPATIASNEWVWNGSHRIEGGRSLKLRSGTSNRYRLTLVSNSGGVNQITSYDETGAVFIPLYITHGGTIQDAAISGGYHRFDVESARVVYINATGLGVGTSFPAARLDIDAGMMRIAEMSAPDNPAANSVVIYAVDNGAGKTQLMAKFATGAAQQIAIEP